MKVSVGNALTRDVFSEVETVVFGHDSGLWMRMFRPNDARASPNRRSSGAGDGVAITALAVSSWASHLPIKGHDDVFPSKLNRFHEDLRTRVGMVR